MSSQKDIVPERPPSAKRSEVDLVKGLPASPTHDFEPTKVLYPHNTSPKIRPMEIPANLRELS